MMFTPCDISVITESGYRKNENSKGPGGIHGERIRLRKVGSF